ncbi:hypothetical protein EMWEY_00045800 [Eimeria maxima]|uniref:Uncharacterized protein n=1 Tax=Eimeria maxima TaxID=5804 RepID=U6MJP7_EIMMA|nr:hypothetical protein EMWEY_00045800 [Eimeria maxima]CDJ61875.1 hypothetical protein EMWEY_00045800 [Eimeria maxima]
MASKVWNKKGIAEIKKTQQGGDSERYGQKPRSKQHPMMAAVQLDTIKPFGCTQPGAKFSTASQYGSLVVSKAGIQMALQESAAKTTPERANCSKRLQFSNGGSAWPRAGYNAPGDKQLPLRGSSVTRSNPLGGLKREPPPQTSANIASAAKQRQTLASDAIPFSGSRRRDIPDGVRTSLIEAFDTACVL